MNKNVLKILIGGLICCSMCQNIAFASDITDVNTGVIDVSFDNGGISPASSYFYRAVISIEKNNGSAEVYARTIANSTVDHIYQDITVYKNYTWVSSKRYEIYNAQTLLTDITVSAKSGDYIDVYVDNYIEHNGTTEKISTSDSTTI